jgi:hypothetical protein
MPLVSPFGLSSPCHLSFVETRHSYVETPLILYISIFIILIYFLSGKIIWPSDSG